MVGDLAVGEPLSPGGQAGMGRAAKPQSDEASYQMRLIPSGWRYLDFAQTPRGLVDTATALIKRRPYQSFASRTPGNPWTGPSLWTGPGLMSGFEPYQRLLNAKLPVCDGEEDHARETAGH